MSGDTNLLIDEFAIIEFKRLDLSDSVKSAAILLIFKIVDK